jgi:hypothetical protein
MTVNPITGINVSEDRFVVYLPGQTSSSNQTATWPRLDGGPVSGGLGGQRWYKKVSTAPPTYDHRYTLQTTFAAVDADPAAPEGHPTGEWRATYALNKLSPEDLKLQVETAFQAEVRKQFPDTENPTTLLLAAKAITKKQSGAVLTAEEQATLDAITSVGDRVQQLVVAKMDFEAAIDADEDYDLSVWPTV